LSSKLNPMVRVPLERIAESEDDLLEILEGYRSEEQAVYAPAARTLTSENNRLLGSWLIRSM